ncbi:unnamed protein product [Pleuronectes platessa]|uniref:FAM194 C-terminal domain-containing protein n=1 Tax=Pleuronectes platessa TaxID=8262 RepID=A0A9N7VUH7_PLEPL|nr:unnamed protein product [Pleuronectes platessa]
MYGARGADVGGLPPLAELSLKCEYCGAKTRPSLGLTRLQEPEHQQLCEMLVKERDVCERRCDLTTVKEEDDDNKFFEDIPIGLGAQSEVKINTGYSAQAATETFAPASSVLRFRLSCAHGKGNWTVCSSGAPERCLKTEQEEPQDGTEFLQKYYSSGKTFLTLFRGGSAQVFYPSGHLAVIVVTEENGSVCIVYDDSKAPNPVMRAVFQSDGRAACYHSNGNIWLSLNTSGGQCLDEAGARVCRWSYPSGHLAVIVVTEENGSVCIVYDDSKAPNPVMRAVFQSDGRAACYHSNGNIWLSLNTSGGQCLDKAGARVCRWRWGGPLHPVFLSLNKAVGVRVFGRKQVFVSFLAQGQHAKFSVGTCCAQGESETDGPASGPSATKEELTALAARDRTLLAIHNLHQCLMKHCQNQLPKTT